MYEYRFFGNYIQKIIKKQKVINGKFVYYRKKFSIRDEILCG